MQPRGPSKIKLDQQRKLNLYRLTNPLDLLIKLEGKLGDNFNNELEDAEIIGFTFDLNLWQLAKKMLKNFNKTMPMSKEEKPKWVIEYDSDAEVLQIYLLNDLTDSMEVIVQIPLSEEDLEKPEDEYWDFDWEKLIREQQPEIWLMAERIAAMLEKGFHKPLHPRDFVGKHLMDGEFQYITPSGHEFLASIPGEEDEDSDVSITLEINAHDLFDYKTLCTKELPDVLKELKFIADKNILAKDTEVIELFLKIPGNRYLITKCAEGLCITFWISASEFQNRFNEPED